MKAQRSTFSCFRARRHSMNSRRFLLSLIQHAVNSKFILSQNTSQTKLLRQRSICNTSCYVIHSERQGSPWRACQHADYRSSVVMTRVSEAPTEGEVLQQHPRPHTHGHTPGASPRPRASGQHNSPQASPRCAREQSIALHGTLGMRDGAYRLCWLHGDLVLCRALFHALRQAHPSVSQPKQAHGSDEDEDAEWADASAALKEQQLQHIRRVQEEQLRHRLEERVGECCCWLDSHCSRT